jgi:carbamoyl-phosphate synthase small subunit
MSLDNYLSSNNIVAISNIDTRALTRHLRINGALKGCIMAANSINSDLAIQYAKDFAGLKNMDLAKVVSTSKTYSFNQGTFDIANSTFNKEPSKFKVAVYDYGVKKNILRMLVDRGCELTVFNAQASLDNLLSMNPDGVFLSNGPGDPEPCEYAIQNIKKLLERNIPIFGICLGHQLLSLASGARTEKMKFGHHGANHPVQDLKSDRVMITSQNHGFAVSEKDLPESIEISHRSLFDQSIQGIRIKNKPAYSFQGHPEASPGPHDVSYLFDEFIELMKQ